nr:immunoglobulin heavy chain junction region [Macaca mulatta]MOY29135.1 immunoglobulin heavy chain junction region [Macaca mulatta]
CARVPHNGNYLYGLDSW